MRLLAKIFSRRNEPIRYVEWVIALFTLFGGFYLFTPLYQTSVARNGLGTIALILAHPLMVLLWASLLLVSSFLVIIGLWRDMPQLKSAGWFGIFLARFFQLMATFMIAGFLPLSWIYPATITAVVVVLWGAARIEVREKYARN